MMPGSPYGGRPNPYAPPAASGPGTDGSILSMETIESLVGDYLRSRGDDNLEIAEIMQFEQNFYVQIREKDTGINAFELLVDPVTGALGYEPGPNMMWNTKYGMMGGRGGMMGGHGGMMGGRGMFEDYTGTDPATEMTITLEEAIDLAQAYLEDEQPGMNVADEGDIFYGYYTIHTMNEGEVVGMLSVNGYSGDVWYHSWHGAFIALMDEDRD